MANCAEVVVPLEFVVRKSLVEDVRGCRGLFTLFVKLDDVFHFRGGFRKTVWGKES